jgi:NACalpha-BTF3-like transcription factor
MEEFFRSGPFEKPVKAKESHAPLKKDDVDLIVRVQRCRINLMEVVDFCAQVRELEIPRAQAEKALIDNEADVTKALLALIQPQ